MRVGYGVGYSAAMEDAKLLIETAKAEADRWYFIANNPQAVEADKKRWLGLTEIIEARQAQQKQYAAWDLEERELIDHARKMVWAGHDDATIATSLGLFLPLVESIRSGVVR